MFNRKFPFFLIFIFCAVGPFTKVQSQDFSVDVLAIPTYLHIDKNSVVGKVGSISNADKLVFDSGLRVNYQKSRWRFSLGTVYHQYKITEECPYVSKRHTDSTQFHFSPNYLERDCGFTLEEKSEKLKFQIGVSYSLFHYLKTNFYISASSGFTLLLYQKNELVNLMDNTAETAFEENRILDVFPIGLSFGGKYKLTDKLSFLIELNYSTYTKSIFKTYDIGLAFGVSTFIFNN